MKRTIIFIIALLLVIQVGTGVSSALERSGDIVREIMNRIDDKVGDLEKKTKFMDEEKEELIKHLKKKYSAVRKERDGVKKESLKVDMLVINAKLNNQDIKEVEAYLETISDLVPDLKRLKRELKTGSRVYNLKEDFNTYRNRIGGFMTKAAGILAMLKDTAPQVARRDIELLQNNLIGIFRCWDSSIHDPLVSLDQIDKTAKDMENAFAQLIIVRRLLDQERINLKIDNFTALANLTLIRLGKGKLGSGSFLESPVKMRNEIKERAEIMRKARDESTPFSRKKDYFEGLRGSEDEDTLKRILGGNYGWNSKNKGR